jgi:hypothetical protein
MKVIRIWLKVCLLVLVFALAGCAASGRVVFHSLAFDMLRDSPDIELLRYRYGSDGGYATKTSDNEIQSGTIAQSAAITGDLLVGTDLYVKWRIKSNGQVFEDTVDLKARLPRDMTRQRLRFIVEGSQLYVYVISYDPIRPYFTRAEVERLDAFHRGNPRLKAISQYARNRVIEIYPRHAFDPHVPLEFRIPEFVYQKAVTPTN